MSEITPKNRASASGHLRGRAGFTLVELMVSLVILGMIMTVIFSLFSTTSDGLKEADSLVNTMDSARFAVERVGSDLKSAGAFASPDSKNDPWVIQGTSNQLCVQGIAGYKDWQNSTAILSTAKNNAHNSSGRVGVSFDGFIVMGAVDFPQTFEVADIVPGPPSRATIPGHIRGVTKLLSNNPFYLDTALPAGINADVQTHFADGLPNRLLRIADRDGNLQFTGISAATAVTGGPSTEANPVELELSPNLHVRQSKEDGSANQKGLDPPTLGDEDIGYGAALVDAYWYHVEPSPLDPDNYRLVRDRLDATKIATALCAPANTNPADALPDSRDQVVIADRVADFQVWFDCADPSGNLSGVDWISEWASPSEGGSCMDVASPSFGEARMAHIRLSLHTRDERKDIPDALAALYNNDASGANPGALRYFNIYPDAPGAARVVTVQSDIALTTFAMRNLH
ncbi:PilW family protein [Bradymonas sediminis]|uniref:Uncharacterized protein n=1 Tax=Bradymonas sediminis TaxID=1548548 RepID=A0A2Z4FPA9_9DELT|nr:prepilin-type N-terminal cleavage/methylation domain-containing protein [Bradymonas sediminis]AWV90793.1 hypothetical protein DN745_16300 [Bradymonas sediminis]TDP75473.1 uncharacterized protein (TIGR02599 family) [Bradymonas sediminis]